MPKNQSEFFNLPRGVAIRSFDGTCIDDISTVLSATELRSVLIFIIWAGFMQLMLIILKSLDKTRK
jgi:hypothetical protein